MAALSTEDAIILILLIGEASGVFAGFCPSWFTVASPFFHEQQAREGNIKRIRAGEAAASAIVLGTGWAVSLGTKSKFPLLASVAISAVFIGGYEYQIAHPSKQPSEAERLQAGQVSPASMQAQGYWNNPT
jgi:hypothetical protein